MKTKIAYLYDEKTKEYLGEATSFLDVEESKAKEEEIFILPADATYIKPPEYSANEIPVWNGECWEVVKDFRGETFYSKKTGESIEIKELGSVSESLTDKPKPDFEAIFDEKINDWYLPIHISNEREKARLLARAEQRIIDLTEATDTEVFDEDEIDPDDVALLKKWKRYRVVIKKVDTSADIINWPELPESEV